MRDRDLKVRKAAAQSLSRMLGRDVVPMVELDEAMRRREVRKLQHAPSKPVLYTAAKAPVKQKVAVLTVEQHGEQLCAPVLIELRTAIRGRTLAELSQNLNQPPTAVGVACAQLLARGQAVQRGQKYFVA